jgi:signal transduction histidine kinase
MNPLRSVGARLTLALALLVAGALGVVYAIVVPSLERNLIGAKVSQLRRAAPAVSHQLPSSSASPDWTDALGTLSTSANARVVVYQVLSASPPSLTVFQDSNPVSSSDVQNDPVASRAFVSGKLVTGTVNRNEARYAEAAMPLGNPNYVLLLAAPLHDSLGNVNLVQRRVLAAGLLALVAALLVGYGAATVFARRIRRLERAAERIAGGDFDEPVDVSGSDELAELAVAFERMRVQLAQLDSARRAFIANASHELRTPIFSLAGFLELLADEELDEPTRREFLETMRGQVDRLSKLTVDLLDLSRLDAGRLHVEREPVDMARIAQDLAGEFAAVAQTSGHPLDAVPEGEALALADQQRTLQIGRILIDNALMHTPVGTRVHVRAVTQPGAVMLTIEDEGPGIPAEAAERVFERFYRADGPRATGSGLGLAIARELATLMGGRIELESRPGHTAFRLVLDPAPGAAPFSRENEPAAVA